MTRRFRVEVLRRGGDHRRLALGGLLLTTIGRMATLLIGGILAALTNLLGG